MLTLFYKRKEGYKVLNNLSKYFEFWGELSADEKDLVEQSVNMRSYEKGEPIHQGKTDCIGLVAIVSGKARTFMLSDEGREITLFRLPPGDVCVLAATCVVKELTFDTHMTAEEDTKIICLPAPILDRLSKTNIYVENFTNKLAAKRFSDVMWAMEQILFKSLDQRLATFLLKESKDTGSTEISLTHEQVANYMGSAREAVSRMLKYFEEEGYVKLSRGKITIVNAQGLKSLT